ncbi:MAG TPA: hypothetical protein VEP30_05580 [Chthoniobacterales bacterium]|nr:hypothetical protein [Chthoniobacterales bacterium]
MKNLNKNKFGQSGFTAAEMIVSTMVLAILGIVFLNVLNSGIILYAKNTAVNTAHEEAREGVIRLTRDIHASIAVPQLRTANAASLLPTDSSSIASSTPVNGVAPTAPGISFVNISFGPQYVWKDPSANGPIMIKGGPNGLAPTVGMHLIAPLYNVEDDIIKVTATPTQANHHNIWLANAGEVIVANKAPLFGASSPTYSIIYYTNRTMYLVQNGTYIADSQGLWILSSGNYVPYTSGTMQRYRYENGELHLYQQAYANNAIYWKDTAIVARYISSPQPFYVPLSSGSPDTKYVGVKLSARDPKSSNRGYLSSASLLDTQIDFRSRIAEYQ